MNGQWNLSQKKFLETPKTVFKTAAIFSDGLSDCKISYMVKFMKQIPKYAKDLKIERGLAYTMPDGWHKGYVLGMPGCYHKTEIRKAFKFVEGKANLLVLILND